MRSCLVVSLLLLCVLSLATAQRKRERRQQQDDSVCFADNEGNGQFLYRCRFPFRYDGRQYFSCTSQDHNKPWCLHARGDKWGECPTTNVCLGGAAPTPRPTPNPTVLQKTAEPTNAPTLQSTPSPSEALADQDMETSSLSPQPITSEPVDNPATQAPSAKPIVHALYKMPLSTFSISLLDFNDGNRRSLEQTASTEEMYKQMYLFLRETYEEELETAVDEIELTLVDLQTPPDSPHRWSWQVFGKVVFLETPTLEKAILDKVTHDGLRSREFLNRLQTMSTFTSTDQVAIRLGLPADNSGAPVASPTTTASSDDSSKDRSGLFVFAVIAAVLCGLGAIAMFSYVHWMYRQHKQAKKEPQSPNTNSTTSAQEKAPESPSTTSSEQDQPPHHGYRVAESESDISISVYSYKRDDGSISVSGLSSDYSFGIPKW